MSRLGLVLLCLGVVACDPLEPTSPQAPELEEEREEIAPPAISHSKPMAPVALDSRVNTRGDQLEIQLTVGSSDPDATIYLSLLDSEGAVLMGPQALDMAAYHDGSSAEHRFLILRGQTQNEVQVLVQVETELGSLNRSLAINLEANESQSLRQKARSEEAQPSVADVDERGELLISLPAQEFKLR